MKGVFEQSHFGEGVVLDGTLAEVRACFQTFAESLHIELATSLEEHWWPCTERHGVFGNVSCCDREFRVARV